MRYYLIAGEASGDLHGSNLMRALQKKDTQASFRFWGGDEMATVGGAPVKHIKDLAFMGFLEVVLNLRTILKNMRLCKEDLLAWKPDVLILIDYPGFNLRLAEFAHKHGIKVVYYISPQVWAWKANRVKKIKRFVDRMICILPFEKDFYARWDYEVDYVGHPLLDAFEGFQVDTGFRDKHGLGKQPIMALVPGSRKQEVAKILPPMLKAAAAFPDHQLAIAAAPTLEDEFLRSFKLPERLSIVRKDTYNLLSAAELAMVKSGTASLETALLGTPEVICYKGSTASFWLARRLVKVKYIGLANLIMDEPIIEELIQADLVPNKIQAALKELLPGKSRREKQLGDFERLKKVLGGKGASERAAAIVAQEIGLA